MVISEIHWLSASSFIWKCSKFNPNLKTLSKNGEKGFCFWENWIWTDCVRLSLLGREYLSSAGNVWRNSLKILHINKRDFFKLNCLWSDQYTWQRRQRSDLNSVLARLPCCLLKGTVKRQFLDIYLRMFFGVRNFGNTLAMTVIFFLEMSRI